MTKHRVTFPYRSIWGREPQPSEMDFAEEIQRGSSSSIGQLLGESRSASLTSTHWFDGLVSEYGYSTELEESEEALAALRVLLPAAIGEITHNLATLQYTLCALKLAQEKLVEIDAAKTESAK